eukprot:3615756-Lingulodinium_polyedra.AAC.1
MLVGFGVVSLALCLGLAMLGPESDEAAHLARAALVAIYCSSCRMWVNGTAQWVSHAAGERHRRNTDPALQPAFTDDQ